MKNIPPEERLIIAADFKPNKKNSKLSTRKKLFDLAKLLKGTGVYIKVNSTLRILGYEVIKELHNLGLKVFVDLKLNDISETLNIDGLLLQKYKPDILTVMCSSGIASIKILKKSLPKTEILGVTIFSSFNEQECKQIYNSKIKQTTSRLIKIAKSAGIGGIVTSAKEIEISKNIIRETSMTINTPGIRPNWGKVVNDDQKRTMTPYEAIVKGADRIIIGRPITSHKNPLEATKLVIEEIKKGLEIIKNN